MLKIKFCSGYKFSQNQILFKIKILLKFKFAQNLILLFEILFKFKFSQNLFFIHIQNIVEIQNFLKSNFCSDSKKSLKLGLIRSGPELQPVG
jgi:hypothetical protein